MQSARGAYAEEIKSHFVCMLMMLVWMATFKAAVFECFPIFKLCLQLNNMRAYK